MSGNVWEFTCSKWTRRNNKKNATTCDAIIKPYKYTIRGASFRQTNDDICSSSRRDKIESNVHSNNIGFRILKEKKDE